MLKKIKLSDIDRFEIIAETTTDNQIYAKYKPDYLLNLSLYDTASGKNITHMKDNGETSGYLFSNIGLGITYDNKPVWIKKDDAYKDSKIKDYCSFSPVLVQNGKKDIDWGNKVSSYVNGNHYRSFCGFNDEYFFLGVSDYQNTIDGLANYCVNQGMKFAGNNDGNGSMSLWEKGKPLKDSGRRNASWLCIWLKKDTTNNGNVNKEDGDEVVTKSNIMVNGKEKECSVIVKDGTTYVKLRDISDDKILVDYDSAKKMAKVDVKD